MTKALYFIDCITNLHVGSGEANYNIIDKEVERDPIDGNPIVHASGMKGALRAWAETKNKNGAQKIDIDRVFGAPCKSDAPETAGSHRFFDARLLCRPMRAYGPAASIKVTTVSTIKSFVNNVKAFGFDVGIDVSELDDSKLNDFSGAEFLVSFEGVENIEGEKVKKLQETSTGVVKKIKDLLGDEFAIAKTFDTYELPVIARNNLTEDSNLWYEEYVPRDSRFYFIVLTEDEEIVAVPSEKEFLQIGGNASIGYGYCRITTAKQGE